MELASSLIIIHFQLLEDRDHSPLSALAHGDSKYVNNNGDDSIEKASYDNLSIDNTAAILTSTISQENITKMGS